MSANKKGANTKQKSARAQTAEFDRVLAALEKESKALQSTPAQKLLFAGSAAWTALAPLFLYVRGVFEVSVRDNAVTFALGVVGAFFALFKLYDALSAQTRNRLVATIRSQSMVQSEQDEQKKKKAEKGVVAQAGFYSLFVVNAAFVTLFLVSVAFLLPPYEYSHAVNFTLASFLSAAAVAGIVAARLV